MDLFYYFPTVSIIALFGLCITLFLWFICAILGYFLRNVGNKPAQDGYIKGTSRTSVGERLLAAAIKVAFVVIVTLIIGYSAFVLAAITQSYLT